MQSSSGIKLALTHGLATMAGLVIMCFFSSFAHGEPRPIGDEDLVVISTYPEYLVDPSGELTLEQVQQLPFERHAQRNPSFGWRNDIIWMKTEIQLQQEGPRFLEVGYPLLDYVDFYILQNDQLIAHHSLGDRQERSSFKVNLKPVIKFPSALGVYVIYARIKSESSIQVPLNLYREDRYFSEKFAESAAFFAYLGIATVMILYNLFIYLSVRNLAYLHYIGFIFLLLLLLVALSGFGQLYLWSEWFNNYATSRVPLLTAIMATLFAISFLDLKQSFAGFYRFLKLKIGLLLMIFLISNTLSYEHSVKLMALVVLFNAMALLTGASLLALRFGHRQARFYLVAWSFFLVGALVYLLKQLGFIPYHVLTHNALLIGSALEITLLSLALGDRYSTYQRNARVAESKRAELQEKLRFELENRFTLISELAHRMNNPLNYICCALPVLEKEIVTDNSEFVQLINDSAENEAQAQQVLSPFLKRYGEIRSLIEILQFGAKKCAYTIAEIRSLSGIDGYESASLSMKELIAAGLERTNDDVNSSKVGKVSISFVNNQDIMVYTNRYAIALALDSMFRLWIEGTQQRLDLAARCSCEPGSNAATLELQSPIPSAQKPHLLESIAVKLNHVLTPYQVTVIIEAQRATLRIPLRMVPGSTEALREVA